MNPGDRHPRGEGARSPHGYGPAFDYQARRPGRGDLRYRYSSVKGHWVVDPDPPPERLQLGEAVLAFTVWFIVGLFVAGGLILAVLAARAFNAIAVWAVDLFGNRLALILWLAAVVGIGGLVYAIGYPESVRSRRGRQ